MKVALISTGELDRFDALAAEFGTVFHRNAWTEQFGRGLLRLGIYEEGGELIGGLCVFVQRRLGLPICRNAPFTPDCGPFLMVKAQNPVAVLETRRDALAAFVNWLRQERLALVLLTFAQSLGDVLPFCWAGYRASPTYTYLLNLDQPIEALLANMASVRRRNIQKARKDGIQVRPAQDLQVVQELVEGTFRRQAKRLELGALGSIIHRFAHAENSYGFVAYKGELAVACSFVVHDRQTAFYLLGGYAEDGKHHGAGALAMWESITRAKDLGLRTFDFEGSIIPAIERYFRGFGGQLTLHFTVSRAWLPLEMILKLWKRSLF